MKKVKKIVSLAMLLVVMATMFSTNVFADGFNYTDNCGEKVAYSFNEETGELVFSRGGKLTVGEWKEKYKNEIKAVKIEEGIISIDASAFAGCTSLQEVTIPASVTEIGERAFQGCENLNSAVIHNRATKISKNAFRGCVKLKSIIVPDSVQSYDVPTKVDSVQQCDMINKTSNGQDLTPKDYSELAKILMGEALDSDCLIEALDSDCLIDAKSAQNCRAVAVPRGYFRVPRCLACCYRCCDDCCDKCYYCCDDCCDECCYCCDEQECSGYKGDTFGGIKVERDLRKNLND